jgi:general stress protein CsbA
MESNFHIGIAVLILLGFGLLDFLSSWFIIALNRLQIATTTILTFLLQMGAGVGVIEYTHNFYYLLFAAVGASLGNVILVLREKRRQKQDKK